MFDTLYEMVTNNKSRQDLMGICLKTLETVVLQKLLLIGKLETTKKMLRLNTRKILSFIS